MSSQSWLDQPFIGDAYGQDAFEKVEKEWVQGSHKHTRVNFQLVILAPNLQMRLSCAHPLNAELVENTVSTEYIQV